MRSLFVLVAAAIALVPPFALASESWQVATDTEAGHPVAATCPMDSDETGHFYCVLLGCAADGALGITVSIAGGGPSGDAFFGVFAVDGRTFAPLAFQRTARTDYLEFRAPHDPAVHGGLLAALQTGQLALLILDPAGEKLGQPILLGGAGPAIATALQGCAPRVRAELVGVTAPPATAPNPTAPTALPSPVAQAQAEILSECGPDTTFDPGFAGSGDLDADGVADILISYAAVQCAAAPTMYCGSGGCGWKVHRGLPGGGWDGGTYFTAYSVTPTADPPGLLLEVHGSSCNQTGAAGPCRQRLIWRDGALARAPGN